MAALRNSPVTKRTLAATLVLYVGFTATFELAPLDTFLQDQFYNRTERAWVVDRAAPAPKAIFYTAPKAALIVFGVYLLAIAAGRLGSRNWSRREALYTLLCMALVPIAVAIAKKFTGVCCPWELARYGGTHEHRTLIEAVRAHADCQCYPAGHASGGFGLLGLAFAGRRRSFWPGMAAGWIMGFYQMLRGAHFLSHTVASMMLGLVIAQSLALALLPKMDAPTISPPE